MQVLFDCATNLTKLSMLALFIRITHASGQQTARRMALCLAGVVLASAIVFLLVDVFQCRPVSAYWTFSSGPRHCINQANHLLAAGTINTAADLVIAVVFPIQYWSAVDKAKAMAKSATAAAKQPDTSWSRGHRRSKNRSESSTSSSASSDFLVGESQIAITITGPARKRFNLCRPPTVVSSLFVGGLLVVAAGTARTVFTWQTTTSTDGDVTWNTAPAMMASSLELSIGIVCSLPSCH